MLCRIQRMVPRSVVLIAVFLLSSIVLACGVSNEGGSDGDTLTAELVVPPAKQETVAAPTATRVPPTFTDLSETSDAAISKVSEAAGKRKRTVNVPNRGYNAMGGNDAPITMFDFSDFL